MYPSDHFSSFLHLPRPFDGKIHKRLRRLPRSNRWSSSWHPTMPPAIWSAVQIISSRHQRANARVEGSIIRYGPDRIIVNSSNGLHGEMGILFVQSCWLIRPFTKIYTAMERMWSNLNPTRQLHMPLEARTCFPRSTKRRFAASVDWLAKGFQSRPLRTSSLEYYSSWTSFVVR